MNKRLRKKKHLGKFQELGFDIGFTLVSGCDEDAFIDRLIEAVEARGLMIGGNFVARHRGSATQEDRAALREFLAQAPVITFRVYDLRDAWYGYLPRTTGRPFVEPSRLIASVRGWTHEPIYPNLTKAEKP